MAGSFDRNWRVGGKSRGTRSQFRLEGLQPFKCTYPVHLTDMMDASQPTQANLLRADFATSPAKETRTRAVREYEQTIDQLRKENFDLKLKIFLTEEEYRKRCQNKTDCNDETDSTVQVIVNLKVETETLRNELIEKDQQLEHALDQAEKYALDLKELQDKLIDQQELLSLVGKLPSTEEFKEMQDQVSELVSQNEYLNNLLVEKDKEIEEVNAKIKELMTLNKSLEEKIKHRNSAIKGCALKYYEDVQKIPKDIRHIIKSAVEAAHNNNEADMIATVETFKSYLCQIMPEPTDVFKYDLHSKTSEDSHMQLLSEDLQKSSGSQSSHEVAIHEETELLPVDSSLSVSKEDSRQGIPIDISCEMEKSITGENASYNFESVAEIINENESLKEDIQEKSTIINNLTNSCTAFECRLEELKHQLEDAYSKVQFLELKSGERKSQDTDSFSLKDSTAQTDIQWHLLQSKISDKNMYEVGNSNHIGELKEEILMLLLAIEQKDQELVDVKENILSFKDDIGNSKIEDAFTNIDEGFATEREDLHRRLAISSSVNNELLKHLQSLERFMEELLLQKNMSTSSMENINESCDFFSQLSKCLDESLKLSHALSDQLSICEGSKIFEPSNLSISRESLYVSEGKSFGHMLDSRFSQNESDMVSNYEEGMNNFLPSNNESNVNSVVTGKRRLPFSSLQKSSMSSISADPDNVVILKTSNNEDLILLLNDQGDPKDVLIRNNHSLLDKTEGVDQLHRRRWDMSMNSNFWKSEKFSAVKENVYNVDQMGTLKPSSMRYNSWMSSDSDTWSEPDRNVSMQRIGIDVQTSPVTSRSPRKSRFNRRLIDVSSSKNESASSYVKLHPWSKRRKSSDMPKLSFTCKKCLKQSQQEEDFVKDEKSKNSQQEIQDLNIKFHNQEKHLNYLYDVLKEKKGLIESLDEEKQELSTLINNLKEELGELKKSNDALSLKNTEFLNKLTENEGSNNALKDIINALEKRVSESDSACDQLQSELSSTKERLMMLDSKCSEYEERLSSSLKDNKEYEEKYKILGLKENELVEDIKKLTLQKDSLLDKLKQEEERKGLVERANLELTKNLKESQVAFNELQTTNKQLEETKDILVKEKALSDKNLVSSTLLCEQLKTELCSLQDSFENLKSKCHLYEGEFHNLSIAKRSMFEKLLNFEDIFVSNLRTLSEVCGTSLELKSESFNYNQNQTNSLKPDNVMQVQNVVERITIENAQFKELVVDFTRQLQDIRVIVEESKVASEKQKHKAALSLQQLQLKDNEIKTLKEQAVQLQNSIVELGSNVERFSSLEGTLKLEIATLHETLKEDKTEIEILRKENADLRETIEALQNRTAETERSLEFSNFKNNSSREQLLSLEKIVEKDKTLMNSKDEEIAKLQERIFSLQSQINKLITDKIYSSENSPSKALESGPASPDSSSVLQVSSNSGLQYACKSSFSNDSSLASLVESARNKQSSSTSAPKNELEKYLKKIKALQTKLEMSEQRIEILEKEKAELRNDLLTSVRENKRASTSSEDKNIKEKLSELEEKLETKQSFIRELKADLYKTHDSLIDKQKDNDKLQHELMRYKKLLNENSKSQHENIPRSSLSDPFTLSAELGISELKKQKDELINSLLNLQKEFYEVKNIHLRHFEKFTNHIDSLRSLQESSSLLKCKSAPLLNSSLPLSVDDSRKWDVSLKNHKIDLEVDIEYLQNFKIFLKRFFTPIMRENCQNSVDRNDDPASPKHSLQFLGRKEVGIQAAILTDKDSKSKLIDVQRLPFARSSESIEQLRIADTASSDRLVINASNISMKLDWIESVLKSVTEEFHHISELNLTSEETSRQTAARSILSKLLEGLSVLQEKADEVFYLNSALKSLELFGTNIPQSTSKQDMSDRESLLSEETITLSRSESLSPVSFEEHFPSRPIHQRMIGKDPVNTYPKQSEVNKSLGPSHKLISSSQDSVFQRSHYSSPDLGIESDPNHEHSAPEHADKFHPKQVSTRQNMSNTAMQTSLEKKKDYNIYSFTDSSLRLKDMSSFFTVGDTLHAIGILQEYELLKKEVAESLIGIKSVISRTGDGLLHVSTSPRTYIHTSPRKNLEYSTFKAIKDTCSNIEVCLQKAHKLINNFRIAPCPSEEELKMFLRQNEELNAKLKRLYDSKKKQEQDFKDVLERLKLAETNKDQLDHKISKKLVKTKKVLRKVEKVMLTNINTELPLLGDHYKIPSKKI